MHNCTRTRSSTTDMLKSNRDNVNPTSNSFHVLFHMHVMLLSCDMFMFSLCVLTASLHVVIIFFVIIFSLILSDNMCYHLSNFTFFYVCVLHACVCTFYLQIGIAKQMHCRYKMTNKNDH